MTKREKGVKYMFSNFAKFSAVLAAVVLSCDAIADQAPNPRSAVSVNAAGARGSVNVERTSRRDGVVRERDVANTTSARSAVVSRSGTVAGRAGAAKAVTARSATSQSRDVSGVARSAKTTATTARSAMSGAIMRDISGIAGHQNARSAIRGNVSHSGMARAASKARATALFTDISKLGGGYTACRESYATCMDQFCGAANDTYRRCFCSERFTEFHDMELAMDEAKVLLQRFEDNNLNAVNKTAAEVNAMYSATVGEAAIKNDTSGAQNILNEIGDLLSGKKKASQNNNASGSLGIMSLDFSTDMDDIWGGGSDIFGSNDKGVDLSTLEGTALYNESNKQCLELIGGNCENNAVLNMATSAYNIMITQDCNAYQKQLDKKREQVMATVRQAEKMLRDARLEEYRAHNSADVNDCLDKVKSALLMDTACGANYKRCLDYSGVFMTPTGEPIYSQRLYLLAEQISLDGGSDVLAQNKNFDAFLDSKKIFASSALDSCRDIADTVWTEFKRSALIEIAQAQDAKIEEVKMSCVSTMKECYDTQRGALKSFDDTTAQTSGALAVYAAKDMCQEKVNACASLYGDPDGCEFDGNGKLTAESTTKKCGLASLLNFVDSVDDVRVAEGCAAAVENYAKELCTPTAKDSTYGYPFNCAKMKKIDDNGATEFGTESLEGLLSRYAVDYCANPADSENSDESDEDDKYKVSGGWYGNLPSEVTRQVESLIDSISEEVVAQLSEACEKLGGYWRTDEEESDYRNFAVTLFGRSEDLTGGTYGACKENSVRTICEGYNEGLETPVATYDVGKDECKFTNVWYQERCGWLGGYFENDVCYVLPFEKQE